jgi:hypothetical protein
LILRPRFLGSSRSQPTYSRKCTVSSSFKN